MDKYIVNYSPSGIQHNIDETYKREVEGKSGSKGTCCMIPFIQSSKTCKTNLWFRSQASDHAGRQEVGTDQKGAPGASGHC